MNEKTKNIDPGVNDLLINAAYGSAGFFDRLKVKKIIKNDPELRAIYNEYKSTADSVHSLENEAMPDSVLHNAELITESKLSKRGSSFLDDLLSVFFGKPQLTFVVTAVIIAMVTLSIFKNHENDIDFESSQFTRAEVELANKQAKQALMLVGQILNSTSSQVTEEIIPTKVVKPINESLEYVNELFKKGDI